MVFVDPFCFLIENTMPPKNKKGNKKTSADDDDDVLLNKAVAAAEKARALMPPPAPLALSSGTIPSLSSFTLSQTVGSRATQLSFPANANLWNGPQPCLVACL